MTPRAVDLLGASDIRALAAAVGLRPSKTRGQNFVHDANTVRRIVAAANLEPRETVLEVGPGLGSLTLGLLAADADVVAVEIESALAAALPATVVARGARASALTVIAADALRLDRSDLDGAAHNGVDPTALVANLPYNVAVPVVLHLLATLPSLRHGLVMVQSEVADRMVAGPGSRTYGTPSVKLAWYAHAERAGTVPRAVFWPVPNVESALVRFARHPSPAWDDSWPGPAVARADVFTVVDAAFAQRRKTLRSALARLAGDAARAETALVAARIDPGRRGETLDVEEFARLTSALAAAR